MSETTRKLRAFKTYSVGACGVRDLAADAIEAVEAQVAEVVARVEKVLDRLAALETRPTIVTAGSQDDDRVTRPAPVRRFKVGDRVRFVAEPKWTSGYLGTLGTIERIPGEATLEYYIASDVSGMNGDHVSANDADLEPAPSAVPAPRGFKKGDVVRHCDHPSEDWTVEEADTGGVWCAHVGGLYYADPELLTLVRAADAPEAPAEEDTGLVVQRIRDEATKPLHVEIEKLRGEVARLTAERDEAQGASILNANAVRLQKARAEAAEKALAEARAISAATAERVRTETQTATELRKDLADARDRIASKDRSIEVMLAETRALREALDAERSGVATKLHDAGFNNVENLVGAYRFERAQADALRFSARTWFNAAGEPELLATAEEVTERRKAAAKELAALKSKPRFRTRKVTKADVEDFIAHDGCFYESLRALGFRRRVDGAK